MRVYNYYYGYIDKEKLRQIRPKEKKEYFEMKKEKNKNEESADKEILKCKRHKTTLCDKIHQKSKCLQKFAKNS